MNTLTFKPAPEVNEMTLVAPSTLNVYTSLLAPEGVTLALISDDKYMTVEGMIRLTAEQTESLFYGLGSFIGDELFDAGFKAGQMCSEGAA